MKPIEKIDAALDSVLKESGSSIEYYILSNRLSAMREAMKKIMVDSFNDGIASTLGVREEFIKNEHQN